METTLIQIYVAWLGHNNLICYPHKFNTDYISTPLPAQMSANTLTSIMPLHASAKSFQYLEPMSANLFVFEFVWS